MTLIDKKENLEFGLSGDGFRFEDVKEAVLEYRILLQTKIISIEGLKDRYESEHKFNIELNNAKQELRDFDEIFGDFEK
jgi:hypothetical protein